MKGALRRRPLELGRGRLIAAAGSSNHGFSGMNTDFVNQKPENDP
jgi:hypothetical protein